MTNRRDQLAAGGEWLRARREGLGIRSAAELARRLGVDRSLVNNWESGKHAPSEAIVDQLATEVDVTVDQVREAFGMYVSQRDDGAAEPVKWTRSQIESVITALRERRGTLKSPAVIAEVDEAIRLLELARTRELRREMIAYGEGRSRTA